MEERWGFGGGGCDMRGGAVAEGAGFEPAEPCGSPVFKTGAIDHSTTPPGAAMGPYPNRVQPATVS